MARGKADARRAAHGALQLMADAGVLALREGRVAGVAALPDLPGVRLRVSARLTRSGGVYRPGGDIAVSAHFLATHGVERAGGIVLHELAHHAVHHLYGRAARPHGREFKAVAGALGADLRAEAFTAPRLVYLYRCPTCGWEWRRGRRIRRGRQYSCARCSPAYDPRHRLAFAGRRRE